jgi:ADP-ribose pyrophosphatase
MDQPTTQYTGRFLKLVQAGRWEYVDRVNARNAAIIVAVTAQQELLLVEQYRIPVQARTIELPAGVIGDEPGNPGESAQAAAGRELREETGYAAGRLEVLTTGPSSSGLTSERVTLFRATGLTRIGPGGGVAGEDITVHAIPLAGVSAWLAAQAQTGRLIDPKVYAGLYFASVAR